MARKSKKTRRQAHAGRRARRQNKKGQRRSTFEMMPPIAGLPPFFVSTVAEGGEETYYAYVAAHMLVPKDHPAPTAESQAHVARALGIMENPTAPPESLLWAVMILGHTPDPSALQALQKHTESGREHADLARLAADECAEWIRQPMPAPDLGSQLIGGPMAAPSMLN